MGLLRSSIWCSALVLFACSKTPPEPVQAEPAANAAATTSTPVMGGAASSAPNAAPNSQGSSTAASPATGSLGVKGADPLAGNWGLADATKDLKGKGALVATIDTSKGSLECKLYDDKAPVTVANFIGLASGTRPWKDPQSGEWVKRPAYDGTTFHRIIKGFMIQGGDPKGNGSGEPGYVIKDEIWSGAKHDRAGLLCMANRGPNTNGAQFFITDDAAAHLDGNYTIFGECSPVSTVHDIASVKVTGEKPQEPVVIRSVKVARAAK